MKHELVVSVSIDGPPQVNDLDRVTSSGAGSADATLRGIALLQKAAAKGCIAPPSAIAVLNSQASGRDVFRFIVRDLGIKTLNVLMRDMSYIDVNGEEIKNASIYLKEFSKAWIENDDPDVDVVFLTRYFQRKLDIEKDLNDYVISVSSDYEFGPNDAVLGISPDAFGGRFGLSHVLDSCTALFDSLQRVDKASSISKECGGCPYIAGCRSGELAHRFDPNIGFERRSVYCEALKSTFGYIEEWWSQNPESSIEAES